MACCIPNRDDVKMQISGSVQYPFFTCTTSLCFHCMRDIAPLTPHVAVWLTHNLAAWLARMLTQACRILRFASTTFDEGSIKGEHLVFFWLGVYYGPWIVTIIMSFLTLGLHSWINDIILNVLCHVYIQVSIISLDIIWISKSPLSLAIAT